MNIESTPELAEEPPIRVMAIHALAYCERLFYLEEVEEIREADDRVYAGRRLHEERVPKLDDDSRELRSFEVSSDELGLFGKVDAARVRDGGWIAYEHKKGRCRRAKTKPKRRKCGRVIDCKSPLMRCCWKSKSENPFSKHAFVITATM